MIIFSVLDDKNEKVWDDKNVYKFYYVPGNYQHPDRKNIESIPFGQICQRTLQAAKKGEIYPFLKTEEFYKLLKTHNLIHHSAGEGIVNKPTYNEEKGCYFRAEFLCKEGS